MTPCCRPRRSAGSGPAVPSRTAAENASPCTPYGSAAGTSMISRSGATGGSPPAARTMRVGRSGGMLNGISTSSRPAVPIEVDPLVVLELRRARERRVAAAEVEHGRRQDVGAEPRVAPHGGDDVVRFAVEHPAGDVDRVAPDVHQRPAAVRGDVADVVGIDVAVREERLDRQQLADRAVVDERPDPLPQRVEAVHERLHQQHAGARRTRRPSPGPRPRSSPAASRTARACRRRRPAASTRRGGGWAAGCTPPRRRGRRAARRTTRRRGRSRARRRRRPPARRPATRWRRRRSAPTRCIAGIDLAGGDRRRSRARPSAPGRCRS